MEERMPGIRDMRVLARLFFLACLALPAPASWAADGEGGAKEQAQRQQTQPLNNAPVWREVRKGENPYQTSQVRGPESTILVQSEGETWRRLRNGPITIYGGWVDLVGGGRQGDLHWGKGRNKPRGKPPTPMRRGVLGCDRIELRSTCVQHLVTDRFGTVIQ